MATREVPHAWATAALLAGVGVTEVGVSHISGQGSVLPSQASLNALCRPPPLRPMTTHKGRLNHTRLHTIFTPITMQPFCRVLPDG